MPKLSLAETETKKTNNTKGNSFKLLKCYPQKVSNADGLRDKFFQSSKE